MQERASAIIELIASRIRVDNRLSPEYENGWNEALKSLLDHFGDQVSQVLKELEDLVDAVWRQDREIEQILGKALGYPRYCDDQASFPGSTEADGVCVGEHTPASLASEAADKISCLELKCHNLTAELKRFEIQEAK